MPSLSISTSVLIMNTAAVCAPSAAALRIHAITARTSRYWRVRPSPPGITIIPG
jgi:hypothetical protein